MAKSGTISAIAGSDEAMKSEVAASDPKVASLGVVVGDALTAASDEVQVVVDTKFRKVLVLDPSADTDTFIGAVQTNLNGQMEISMDESGKRSCPWTIDPASASPVMEALEAKLAATKPSFTVAGLVSAIEDVLTLAGRDAVIIVDQVASKVIVSDDTPANINTFNSPAAAGIQDERLAVFEQTVTATSGPKPAFE